MRPDGPSVRPCELDGDSRGTSRCDLGEHAAGALWVLPTACAAIALVAGYALSHVDIGPSSSWDFLAFQGTADDARSLLVTIAGTVVTVIALVLGLTVVALQLSSTQFSPRLLPATSCGIARPSSC